MTSDTFHTYTYDAEGNILQADSGQTAVYIYDALNHKVQDKIGSQDNEYIFDLSGRVTSNWLGSSALEGHIFADGMQVAYRANGQTYFNHKEWLNTDRVHTDLNGATAAVYTSLPWGDGGSATDSEAPYAGWDFQRFGDIDFNWETNTYPARFRTYSPAQGRWLSPDPYDGSYNATNPQSLNRYAYLLNNPLSYTDKSGQGVDCPPDDPCPPDPCADGTCFDDEPWYCVTYGDCGPSNPGSQGPPVQPPLTPEPIAPNRGTSTCTISNGRTTAIAPGQAPGVGAFGFVPPAGSVAIDPWALGLPPGGSTNALLGPNASQITFTFSSAPKLPSGYPTTITLGSVVGPKSVRTGGANFNGLFDFDFYGMPSLSAAYAVTSPAGTPVAVTVTYPSSLPISCNGPALDSPIQGPLPSPPGPVSAVRRRLP